MLKEREREERTIGSMAIQVVSAVEGLGAALVGTDIELFLSIDNHTDGWGRVRLDKRVVGVERKKEGKERKKK